MKVYILFFLFSIISTTAFSQIADTNFGESKKMSSKKLITDLVTQIQKMMSLSYIGIKLTQDMFGIILGSTLKQIRMG